MQLPLRQSSYVSHDVEVFGQFTVRKPLKLKENNTFYVPFTMICACLSVARISLASSSCMSALKSQQRTPQRCKTRHMLCKHFLHLNEDTLANISLHVHLEEMAIPAFQWSHNKHLGELLQKPLTICNAKHDLVNSLRSLSSNCQVVIV